MKRQPAALPAIEPKKPAILAFGNVNQQL